MATTPPLSLGSIRGRIASPPTFGPPMIGALLRMPWERVVRRMLERLREQGFDDLDMAHMNLFLYPGPQGARPSEHAAQRGMSKQAANYLLGQLERLGYLERRPDAGDRRSKRIALTDRGERAAHTIRDAVRSVEREWEEQLGQDRFAQLRTLLVELNQPA
jgi:DNA-binding MarR family transcriptional regulator